MIRVFVVLTIMVTAACAADVDPRAPSAVSGPSLAPDTSRTQQTARVQNESTGVIKEYDDSQGADTPQQQVTLLYLLFGRYFDPDLNSQSEKLTQDCMESLGWTYYPVTHDTLPENAQFLEFDPTVDSDFVNDNGYGISLGEAELAGADATNIGVAENQAYQDALTPEQFRSYSEALFGPPGGARGGGCWNGSRREVFGDAKDAPYDLSLFTEIDSRVAANSEVVLATAQWSQCMSDAGYIGFTTRNDARQYVQDTYDQRLSAGLSVEDTQAIELAVASADLTCYQAELQRVEIGVRRQMEAAYLDEHPELELYVAEVLSSFEVDEE